MPRENPLKSHLRIGRPFGVEVGLHVSWFVIASLILMSLVQRFGKLHPQWGDTTVWLTAGATALLFFVALALHELSHALVARSHGLPVRSITLFALGGVAQIGEEARDSATEFWMAVAGPLASVGIGAGCLALAHVFGWTPVAEPEAPALAALVWLGYINVSLAAFNLIPAYPMDGGRILRAALWRARRDLLWATRWSARVGQAVAIAFTMVGLFLFLGSGSLQGLWIALIGWFLMGAADVSYTQLELTAKLRGTHVADVMRRDCLVVDGDMCLDDFVARHLLPTGGHAFVVTQSGSAIGIVTLHEVKPVPRARWAHTTVREIMVPLDSLQGVSPRSPLSESVEIMGRNDETELPVLDGGRLLGLVSRGAILRFLRTREALHL